MTWSPDNAGLNQLCLILQHAVSADSGERQQALDALETFKLEPQFANYLCYILLHLDEMDELRGTAGILLKNCILGSNVIDLAYVKSEIVRGLCLKNKFIVKITGIVITALYSNYYRQHREDPQGLLTLEQLMELAKDNNEGAISALSKMMEDGAQFFQLPWSNNQVPISELITLFLKLMMEGKSPVIRSESINCLNNIIPLECQELSVNLDALLSNVFSLASNESSSLVKQQICQCLTLILQFRPDKLMGHLQGIVQFMGHLIISTDRNDNEQEKVALGACEFLLALVSDTSIPDHLIQPYIQELVPLLLTNMVYSQDEIIVMEASNDDDANSEDKDEDIKPVSAKIQKKNDDNNDDEDDDDDEDDGNFDHEWNLRKCAASVLDILTRIFPKEVIETALPLLREHLTSDNWYISEATTLSLGAMAEGGIKYFDSQLPALIPFLVEQLRSPWFPVRRMTCWTLSRFSTWILDDHTEFLIPVINPIMQTLLDKKKGVQEAAITSIATFIENSDPDIVSTILYEPLLEKFDECFRLYQKKNLIILYDAVSRLSEKCDFDEDAMKKLLPHLLKKWSTLDDNDKELWPLLECLSYVSTSAGTRFAPMAMEVYNRAWNILCRCVELEAKSHSDPSIVVPEKDFTITSLDLIDGLLQGLGYDSKALLFPNHDLTMFSVILQCLQDHSHEVRQSAYALLGDIAYFYERQLFTSDFSKTIVETIGNELIQNAENLEAVSTVNNAIWCLGLMAHKIDLGQYIIEVSRVVLDLFCSTQLLLPSSVLENLCITIARLAHFHPEIFTHLPFGTGVQWNKWCAIACELSDPEEKTVSYAGFVKIMNLTDFNSQGMPSDKTWELFFRGLQQDVDISILSEDLYALAMRLPEHWQQLLMSSGMF
ncbi:unnamed protein product [Kluyveromyces dobzhanskii CBS 2104]|uniref:WGS project CCBQ000000000 data, contig MAT n=1 Tax=Kluyveromyces dobzhanskii CBS 2104 TaxID=1427455 RepID=A0A0A8L3S6_9SACH|nr:unnamed protein product [Kluyveromyces dobzhanskii CBS 2104]